MPASSFAKFLSDAHHSGLYTLAPERRPGLEKGAAAAALCRRQVDLGACATAATALAELGRALAFPDWYGANFDALNDCLSDPDWQPALGHLIFIDGLATLRNGDPEGFATLTQVLSAVAAERRESGHLFWLLLDTTARGVPALPRA